MKKTNGRLELKIGAFATLGLGLALAAIWMLGSTHDVFSRKQPYYFWLSNAEGVQAGTVEGIELDPKLKKVRVTLTISRRYEDSIREDSTAEVTTHGVLGDKMVAITAGDPSSPKLAPGSEIHSESTSALGNLLGPDAQELMQSATLAVKHLDIVLSDLAKSGKTNQLMDGLISASKNIAESSHLLNEQLNGMRLKSAVGNLDSILGKADHGNGTVSGLLNDPALYDDTKALLGESNGNRILRNVVRKSVEEKEAQNK
jgi:phospholipid/cholesterol/gamma-HCH transport system substrate-binding protein